MHGARATKAHATAVFGPRQANGVAQDPKQGSFRRDIHFARFAIQSKTSSRHRTYSGLTQSLDIRQKRRKEVSTGNVGCSNRQGAARVNRGAVVIGHAVGGNGSSRFGDANLQNIRRDVHRRNSRAASGGGMRWRWPWNVKSAVFNWSLGCLFSPNQRRFV